MFEIKSTPEIRRNRKVLVFGVLGLILIVLAVNLTNEFIKQNKVSNLIESANQLLNEDDFVGAGRKINEAIELQPRNIAEANLVRERITSTLTGISLLKDAEEKISKQEFLNAIYSLRRVTSTERGLLARAQQRIIEIESSAEAEFNNSISRSLKSKDFVSAVSVIDSYKRAFPESEKFDTLRIEYVAKSVAQIDARKRAALGKLSKKYDSFQDVTWYQSPSSTKYRNANAFYLYFGVSNGSPMGLRLVVQYYSDDWLFIDSAKINVDGTIYDLDASNWERDNDSDIWEWIDEPLSDRSMIEAIIASKSSVIRFEGKQYYDTRTISSSQKSALKQVIAAFDSL